MSWTAKGLLSLTQNRMSCKFWPPSLDQARHHGTALWWISPRNVSRQTRRRSRKYYSCLTQKGPRTGRSPNALTPSLRRQCQTRRISRNERQLMNETGHPAPQRKHTNLHRRLLIRRMALSTRTIGNGSMRKEKRSQQNKKKEKGNKGTRETNQRQQRKQRTHHPACWALKRAKLRPKNRSWLHQNHYTRTTLRYLSQIQWCLTHPCLPCSPPRTSLWKTCTYVSWVWNAATDARKLNPDIGYTQKALAEKAKMIDYVKNHGAHLIEAVPVGSVTAKPVVPLNCTLLAVVSFFA